MLSIHSVTRKMIKANHSISIQTLYFVYMIMSILLDLVPSFLAKRLLQASIFHNSHFHEGRILGLRAHLYWCKFKCKIRMPGKIL